MPTVDANILVASHDPTDAFHERSVSFLRDAAQRGVPLLAPAFVLVEVACVVARRFRDPAEGARAANGVTAGGLVQIVSMDDRLVELAMEIGTQRFLRGADALYAATAELTDSTLVSWDNELIQRAGALSPTDWLDANV